ncbi:hypothetical protein [Zooshikella harenae]|uniref:Uncharacterized protein n=1 Tax=Zooshikella harenae TaxID=2827238 RepID=A0ABS5ZGS5_9GAMM|nr:hypothetical protein [Zooshikella harenae]MBU2713269.1 hypothetical protein [Zooshikella harenae]
MQGLTGYTLDKAKNKDDKDNYSYSRPSIIHVKNAYFLEEKYLSLCMNIQMESNKPSKEYSYTIHFDELKKYVSKTVTSDIFALYEVDTLHFKEGCDNHNKLKSLPVEEIKPQQLKKFNKIVTDKKVYLVRKANSKQNYIVLTSNKDIIDSNKTVLLTFKQINKINGISIDTSFLWYGAIPFAVIGDAVIITGIGALSIFYIFASGCNASTDCRGGF